MTQMVVATMVVATMVVATISDSEKGGPFKRQDAHLPTPQNFPPEREL